MPETIAVAAPEVADWFIGATAADVAGVGAAEAGAGLAAGGAVAGDMGMWGYGADAVDMGAGTGAAAFGDAVAGYETLPSGADAGGGTTTGGGSNSLFGDQLGQLFQRGGKGISSMFGKGGQGKDIMSMLAGLYGLQQSAGLKRMAVRPNLMGEQAVQRSMAAQGYQGSGNMMAALNQYGINGSQAASQYGMGPLVGQLSSIGLLTSGSPALASIFGDH